ncbi:MAG: sugar ABC transporter permease [Candidatus Nanopelagicales bacterium]|nr:sugar ABC transporter permease [Dermatophilaceae bacterium]HPZ69808.1 sugar ABC transporter permease [Dermatophilaceae bacterium]
MSVQTANRATAAATATPSRAQRRSERRAIIGFLAPFGTLFLLFYLLPIGYSFVRSFFVTERDGAFGPARDAWGGLSNYAQAISDPALLSSVGRVLLFGVVQVPVMLIIAMLFALILDSSLARLKRFFRLSYFVPYAVPVVIGTIVWGFLFTPGLGPVADFFPVDFLGDGWVLWSIAIIVTWTYAGYNMLIMHSNLQAIDRDIYEAAHVDGATNWQIALRIKIPLIRDAVILTGVFSIIGTLQLFTEPQVLRSISTSISSTYTPNLLVFTAASGNAYNYAAALSFLLAAATAVLSFLFLKFSERWAQ